MKAFYAVFLLVFLASCGSEVVVETATPETPEVVVEQTVEDMEAEMNDMPEEIIEDEIMEDETASVESEVQVLDAGYTNPKGPVDMQVEYTLAWDGTIASIDVSATSYDVSSFNNSIQSVVGMTIQEASESYVSGSSLTSAAFNNALKSAM